MKRQTAANNKFLAGVKRRMNKKIYGRVLQLMNPSSPDRLSGGPEQARVFLQQFFNRPVTIAEFEN